MRAPDSVRLPNDWHPRPYQRPLWGALEQGCKRAVAVWHRRAGKDSVALNWAAVSGAQRVGTYFHCLPELKHARKVVWDGIDRQGRRMIDQAFPPALREATHDNEMRLRLVNGSVWQCVGSDNVDSIVGTNPVGVTFSEYALSSPAAWDLMRPILAENDGWALFIGTPRGENHFADLYRMGQASPDWFAELLTVDDTRAIGSDAIARERDAGMPEALIKQEFFCSFQSGVAGAYFGTYLETAQAEGRIGRVAWEPQLPVVTAWDLGMDDATAIWFVQVHRRELRVIDYYETSGVGLEHYTRELDRKPYTYADHLLPHDAKVRELGTGKSRLEILHSLGLRASVVPMLSVEDGIAAARSILPRCWFDEEKCARGLKALRSYRTEYDEKAGVFRARPLHDWSSHGADAFRSLAVGLARVENRAGREPMQPQSDGTYNYLRGRQVA